MNRSNKKLLKLFNRTVAIVSCLVMMLVIIPSSYLVSAEEAAESKVVRVGWYESPFNMIDQYGRRSGYAYDYQMKISAYTGWTYEYVTGSWPELLNMLAEGRIDLLSDVSFMPERQDKMLFSSVPMGAETYYACVSAKQNTGITAEDLTTMSGKRIGVNAKSYQEDLLIQWLDRNGLEAEIVEITKTQSESVEMVNNGEIDVYVNIDLYGFVEEVTPVFTLGSSDFYFAVSNSRSDLLGELNSAMARILEENRNYNQHLHEKYFNANLISLNFTYNEVNWLASHGAVRVGYLDNFLAFCSRDDETGKLTGALRDYLDSASKCMNNATVVFEPVAYDTVDDAIKALGDGEIDCVFPVNLTAYDAENLGVLRTENIMQTEVYAAVRSDRRHLFSTEGEISVALTEADRNLKTFVLENFPDWSELVYVNREACLDAVAKGEADCVLLCNYEIGRLDDELEKKDLTPISIGSAMNFSFAVDSHADSLYAILNKTSLYVPASSINSALVSYSYDAEVFSFTDFLREHMVPILSAAGGVVLLILILMIRAQTAERKAKKSLRALRESLDREEKQKQELSVTKNKVYTDSLTGVKSKHAYSEDNSALQQSIDNGEKPEFAVIVFDVNDLKKTNDIYGHEAGDRRILSAKKLICDVFKHSPVYRIGGDEFVVILTGEDYENGVELLTAFDRKIDDNAQNGMTVVSAGYAEFNPGEDTSFSDVFQRADGKMYQRKRQLKRGGSGMISPSQAYASQAAASPVNYSTNSANPANEAVVQTVAAGEPKQGGGTITIECGGVQVRAASDITAEKFCAILDALRLNI